MFYEAATYPGGSLLDCTYLSIPQAHRTNAVVLSKPTWMWGAEMGANEVIPRPHAKKWRGLGGSEGAVWCKPDPHPGSVCRQVWYVATRLCGRWSARGSLAIPLPCWVWTWCGEYPPAHRFDASTTEVVIERWFPPTGSLWSAAAQPPKQ